MELDPVREAPFSGVGPDITRHDAVIGPPPLSWDSPDLTLTG